MNHKQEQVLVSRTMEPSDTWAEATTYIGRRSDLFSLYVESRPSVVGDLIALDDFSLVDCTFPQPPSDGCGNDRFTCTNGKLSFVVIITCLGACTDMITLCDGSDDCGDFSDESEDTCATFHPICTFESDCDWSDVGGDFHWEV